MTLPLTKSPHLRFGSFVTPMIVALFSASAVGPAFAAADGLKNLAILGSLVSYGHGVSLSPGVACKQSFRAGFHYGKDAELGNIGFSMGLKDCEAPIGPSKDGFIFRLVPTVMLSGWSAESSAANPGTSEVTFTPKVFYSWPAMGQRLDVGFGIGVSYLMDPSVGNRRKSTNFQFSDEVSFGISDSTDTYRLAYQYRHISNADIGTPNNGVDFSGLTFTVRMR